MNPESAADRLALLADWGEDVSVTPAGGGDPVSIRGIYDAEPRRVELEDDVEFVGGQPELLCRAIDVEGFAQFSTVSISSRPELPTYEIHAIEPDGTGFMRVVLLEAD